MHHTVPWRPQGPTRCHCGASTPAPQGDNQKCFQTWPNVPGARSAPADSAGLDPLPRDALLLLPNHVAASPGQHGDCPHLLRATRTDACPGSQGSPAPGYRSRPVRNWAAQQDVSGGRPSPAPPASAPPTSSGSRVPREPWSLGPRRLRTLPEAVTRDDVSCFIAWQCDRDRPRTDVLTAGC